jgi:hypothetical protein
VNPFCDPELFQVIKAASQTARVQCPDGGKAFTLFMDRFNNGIKNVRYTEELFYA